MAVRVAGDYLEADHWNQISNQWPDWCTDFSPHELATKGQRQGEAHGSLRVHLPTLRKLQELRTAVGRPMITNSAYRSPAYNRRIGGASRSQHVDGKAFDISMANHDPHVFERRAKAVGFTGFGYYPQSNFMHIDTGRVRWWGTRWPAPASTAPQDFEDSPIRPTQPSVTGNVAAGAGAVAAAAPALLPLIQDTAAEVERAQSIGVPWLAAIGVVIALAGAGFTAWTIIKRKRQEGEGDEVE